MLRIACRKCGFFCRRKTLVALLCATCKVQGGRPRVLVFRVLDEDGNLWTVASKDAVVKVLAGRREARAVARRLERGLRRMRRAA